jgi:predicted HTH transcriptional regulator
MSATIDLKELAVRESEQVEWRKNVADEDDVVATICAFANDLANLGGGYVVCGAEETQDEHGFAKVEMVGLDAQTLKRVEGKVIKLCRDRVDPRIAPRVVELPHEDPARRIMVFVVPASPKAHVFRRRDDAGAYYVRVSRETIEARNRILREMLTRKGDIEPWDRQPCATAGVEDLDLLVLREALNRMGVFDKKEGVERYVSDTVKIDEFCPPLCAREPLTGTLRPRNFAMLLFGKDVLRTCRGRSQYSRSTPAPIARRQAPNAPSSRER